MKNVLIGILISVSVANAQRFSYLALNRVNSLFDEQNPIVSPDGNRLYFTVVGHPQSLQGKKTVGDIWYCRWEGTSWSVPIHAGTEINSSSFNSIAGFSLDGKTVYLMSHYQSETQGIATSNLLATGWSQPKDIKIPYFLNKSLLISGYISDDESTLIYSAEGYETRGVEDIYITFKSADGGWSEPKNLGSIVNTSFQELTPTLSPDKTTIYFSSNKPGGFGSFDVYRSKRLDDSWTNWSTPENLGASINTQGRELYFRTFTKDSLALYTTTHSSNEYGDIKLYHESIEKEKVIPTNENLPLTSQTEMVGTVSNSRTADKIEALVYFKSDSINYKISTQSGNYKINISKEKIYSIKVEAIGYITVLEKIDLTKLSAHTIELNFKLQPIEVGVSVNLRSVLFKVSETSLLPESYDELNAVVDLMKANPNLEIELGGHTDSRGDARLNLRLSQGRVEKVKDYLVSKGINGNRIQGKGYGGKKPIAFGDSEESRKLNRRVEFTIIKD